MTWSAIVFFVCFVSLVYFAWTMVWAARSREFQRENERLREDRQLRKLSRRGK